MATTAGLHELVHRRLRHYRFAAHPAAASSCPNIAPYRARRHDHVKAALAPGLC
ncbi:MAG: hypothetical protein ACPGUV_03110 [Polyangiales bacterium]